MGNRLGTNDGWDYRGKGLWQCTGRKQVAAVGAYLGVSPEVASGWLVHPDHALECVCALFHILKVGPSADSGDVTAQTKQINGGTNGLAERKNAYAKAMRLLTEQVATQRVALFADPGEPNPAPVTVADLREDGSRTIKGADAAQHGLVGVLGSIGGATAMLEQTNNAFAQVQSAINTLQTTTSYVDWAQEHWQILAIVGLSALAAFFAYRAWRGANLVKQARVDDANTGANLAR